MFGELDVAFESGDDDIGAEERVDVVEVGDNEASVGETMDVADIGEDEVAEDVGDADVTDGITLLRAEVLEVLECSEVFVGEFNRLSVIAALPQAIYE